MEQNWMLYLAIVIVVVFVFCKIGENKKEQEKISEINKRFWTDLKQISN